ncbi:MAG: WD40/YVTN/BNR-like repeat-containing protein, partial [Flavobacteriia bacterium]
MNKFVSIATLWTAFAVNAQDASVLKGKELFGDLKARQIGPALMSGRVSDIEGHPTNNKVIYIGTAGGGVWKSQDGGVRFNAIFDDLPQSIGAVAVDPSDPDNTVWVGTGEVWTRNSVSIGDGIYRSNDGGKNWTKFGLEKSERISAIEIDPKDRNTIYVGALGALWGDSEDRGVYKTTDGGKTWTKILYVNASTGCSDLIMDPNDPNTLYASFWEFRRTAYSFNSGGINSSLYKSTDGGKTWAKIHNGFPKGKLGRIAVTVAPSNSKILYAVVEAENATEKGLYRSDDAGASWKHLNSDFELTVRPFYFSRIVVDPKDPETVAKAGLGG